MGPHARRQGWDGRRLVVEPLEQRWLLAGDVELFKDFNASPVPFGSDVANFLTVGAVTFFSASTLEYGNELWRTDGTEAGTAMVKDLRPGTDGSALGQFVNVNGMLLFTTLREVSFRKSEYVLWKSDGTEAGTTPVKVSERGFGELTAAGGNAFFVYNDGVTGYELWRSDGTAAGTVIVKDIRPAINFLGQQIGVRKLTSVNGTLFFAAEDSNQDVELWKSDGTATGTVRVKDINPDGSSSPYYLHNHQGTLLFSAGGSAGAELWRSDGTEAGTYLVKDIRPGVQSSLPRRFGSVGATAYFSAYNDGTGVELWKTDGTAAGTQFVKDIRPGVGDSLENVSLFSFVAVGSTAYFLANDGVTGHELWRTDGSAAGTVRVKDIRDGPWSLSLYDAVEYGSKLYFITSNELWKSDGTDAGTLEVTGFRPVPLRAFGLSKSSTGLLVSANDGETGRELWKSDGTDVGTVLVKDLRPATEDTSFGEFLDIGGTIYFNAASMLWRTDGTATGTVVIDNGASGAPGHLTNVGGTLYYITYTHRQGFALWRSDGTAAGKSLVRNFSYPSDNGIAIQLTNVNGTLYFVAWDSSNGHELWKSDGTFAGTTLVKNIRIGTGLSAFPTGLTNVDGTLFFAAKGNSGDSELWKSDGTAAGTVMVKDIMPGSGLSLPTQLINVQGTLFFRANDATAGYELWKSDGTADGTLRVTDILPGTAGSFPDELTNIGGTLYFRANDGAHGLELWRSDGTPAGTKMVKEIAVPFGIAPGQFENLNGLLLFSVADSTHGLELWRSDGTESGTYLVKDIQPGTAGDVRSFKSLGGMLYFQANDGLSGNELWRSDGTVQGTQRVSNFASYEGTFELFSLASIGGRVLFSAKTERHGRELWSAPMNASPPGDYNDDSRIDGADFLAWQRSFGSTAAPAGSGADGDGSGSVGSGDLAVWRAGFGAGSATPLAASSTAVVASELSVASLMASEEVSASAVGERIDDAAADAAFAWLAAERTTTDHGDWKRSPAVEVELQARDHAARSSLLAPSAKNERGGDWKPGDFARKLRTAELSFGASETAAESQGFLAATLDEWTTSEAYRAAIRR